MWPCWNATNTIILDHHEPRVDCNPPANVIVPPSFYVANMKDLAMNNEYLKVILWPTLEGLYAAQDVASFWSTYHVSRLQARVSKIKQFSLNMASHGPCTPTADSRLQSSGGEGTCELVVHI